MSDAVRAPGRDIPRGQGLAVEQGTPPVAQFLFGGHRIAPAKAIPGEPAGHAREVVSHLQPSGRCQAL